VNPSADAESFKARRKKQHRRVYMKAYYKQNRADIRAQQRKSYESKYQFTSAKLLSHLRANPTHACGLPEAVCAECQRLGPPDLAICVECGRTGLPLLAGHIISAHRIPIATYRKKWGYNRHANLTSPAFHIERSRLSSYFENIRRLKRSKNKT
jgi:5-methylcytosine-specific restriction endonuclease McrA